MSHFLECRLKTGKHIVKIIMSTHKTICFTNDILKTGLEEEPASRALMLIIRQLILYIKHPCCWYAVLMKLHSGIRKLGNLTLVKVMCVALLQAAAELTAAQAGRVFEWGYFSIPLFQPVARYKAVATGPHSLALRSDGTVAAWGRHDYGQCDVPNGLSGVTNLLADYLVSLAQKDDGTVVVWGRGDTTTLLSL